MSERNEKETIDRFFASLSATRSMFEELRLTFDEKMAFDFNLFNFFYPDENKLSEILAFLLNPNAAHGQGKAFVREFCNLFMKPEKHDWLKDVKINELLEKEIKSLTEHRTDANRRIDVTVEFGNSDFLIGIENKMWAVDQNSQVNDYSEYLKSKSKNDKYILFYLTPYGKLPSENSIPKKLMEELKASGNLETISYSKDIIKLLDNFIKVCKSAKVRYFLEEFQSYIQHKINGGNNMDNSKCIRNLIAKNEDYRNVALDVFENIDAIKDDLWGKVKAELEESFPGKIEPAKDFAEMCSKKHMSIIKIKNEKWNMLAQFGDNRNASEFYLIIKASEGESGLKWAFMQELQKKMGISDSGAYESNKAIFKRQDDYCKSWAVNTNPWRDMANREGKKSKFSNRIIEFHTEAKEIIDKIES